MRYKGTHRPADKFSMFKPLTDNLLSPVTSGGSRRMSYPHRSPSEWIVGMPPASGAPEKSWFQVVSHCLFKEYAVRPLGRPILKWLAASANDFRQGLTVPSTDSSGKNLNSEAGPSGWRAGLRDVIRPPWLAPTPFPGSPRSLHSGKQSARIEWNLTPQQVVQRPDRLVGHRAVGRWGIHP